MKHIGCQMKCHSFQRRRAEVRIQGANMSMKSVGILLALLAISREYIRTRFTQLQFDDTSFQLLVRLRTFFFYIIFRVTDLQCRWQHSPTDFLPPRFVFFIFLVYSFLRQIIANGIEKHSEGEPQGLISGTGPILGLCIERVKTIRCLYFSFQDTFESVIASSISRKII